MPQHETATAIDDLHPKRTVGDFFLKKRLGSGTMGVVFLAQQISRNRPAAVKVLYPHHANEPVYVERFYREAALLSRIHHPNIVRCYRTGRDKGYSYIGMEYVDGILLRQLVDQTQALPLGNVIHIASVCAEALKEAHTHAIIHRDIKPKNIMLTRSGMVKLADMGIARATDVDTSVTDSGIGMGTMEYMPPEQARSAKKVDHRCDIYALGTVIYELLTKTLPFPKGPLLEMVQAKEQTFFLPASRLNPQVSDALDLIIQKCLKPDPARRYADCQELLDDLTALDIPPVPLNLPTLGISVPDQFIHPATKTEGVIYLIHARVHETAFAMEAINNLGLQGKLEVLANGKEAIPRLRREGGFAHQELPKAIMLSVPFPTEGAKEILNELKANEELHNIPVVVLASTATAKMVMRACNLRPCVRISRPEELEQFIPLLPA